MNLMKIRVEDVLVALEFRNALPEERCAAVVIRVGSIVRPSFDKSRCKEVLEWGPTIVWCVVMCCHLGVPRREDQIDGRDGDTVSIGNLGESDQFTIGDRHFAELGQTVL